MGFGYICFEFEFWFFIVLDGKFCGNVDVWEVGMDFVVVFWFGEGGGS